MKGRTVVYKLTHYIGGLPVSVVESCDRARLVEIAKELSQEPFEAVSLVPVEVVVEEEQSVA